METGNRKDPAGQSIPAHYIKELLCEHNGKPVLTTHLLGPRDLQKSLSIIPIGWGQTRRHFNHSLGGQSGPARFSRDKDLFKLPSPLRRLRTITSRRHKLSF